VRRGTAAQLALALALRGILAAAAETARQPMLGEPAPTFRLQDLLSGKTISLEDLRGRFVVLHFGASW